MQLILVAVDGSKPAERAVKHVIALHSSAIKSALRIGPAAEHILKLAREKRCDQIVMGTRGWR